MSLLSPLGILPLAITLSLLAPPLRAEKPTPPPANPAATPAATPAPPTAAEIARGAAKRLDAYQTKEARAALEPVAGQAASSADVAVALGRLLEQEKKYEESANVLRKAAVAAPADARLPLQLGETLLRSRKMADADVAFRKAVELSDKAALARPTDAEALLVKGTALSRLRRFDEAMVVLEKARERDGANPETLYQMGATRAFQQKWADSVALLTQSLEKDTGKALGYYYRGLAQEKLGRKDLMVVDLDRFVKLAPSAPEADRARALLAAASR